MCVCMYTGSMQIGMTAPYRTWLYLKELPHSHPEKYDVIKVSSVEKTVFTAPHADNEGHYWAVIDSDFCPWWEVYEDDDYGDAIRVQAYTPITRLKSRPKGKRKREQNGSSSDSDTPDHPDFDSGTDADFSSDEEEDSDAAAEADYDSDVLNAMC